jgi:concentrative nucleoside transporter, CNT family
MCGFANLGSLGIMIGGIGTVAPGAARRINSLGAKSTASSTLTTRLIGAIARLPT